MNNQPPRRRSPQTAVSLSCILATPTLALPLPLTLTPSCGPGIAGLVLCPAWCKTQDVSRGVGTVAHGPGEPSEGGMTRWEFSGNGVLGMEQT